MDIELGMAPGRRIGYDLDERARLEVEPRARPQRAENRLSGDFVELLHDRVAVVLALVALETGVAPQVPADRLALPIEFALGHELASLAVLSTVANIARSRQSKRHLFG